MGKEASLGKITTELSMSLDGFIAHADDSVDHLFDWYNDGEIEVKTADPRWTFRTSEASANHIRDNFRKCGCIVSGRRLFDYTNGWGGKHPIGVPVVVVTHGRLPKKWIAEHPDAPFTFVTDGIINALEKAKGIAGKKNVSVAGPNVIQQCINLGLLDEICISLVPVLIGAGIPFFGKLSKSPVKFDGPRIVEGKGVTHLYYTVRK
jgi:dihydrofolate reductase